MFVSLERNNAQDGKIPRNENLMRVLCISLSIMFDTGVIQKQFTIAFNLSSERPSKSGIHNVKAVV